MTKNDDTGGGGAGAATRRRSVPPPPAQRCGWCARPIDQPVGRGRRRRYCKPGCRQQAYVARRQSGGLALGADDVVVSRAGLEELAGVLYCLSAAIEDVDRDLAAAGDDPAEVAGALQWLLDNARPAAAVWLEPRAAGDPGPTPG